MTKRNILNQQTKKGEIMARPIAPTPDIETEEDLKVFIENMNRPPTKEEIQMGKEADEIYKNTKVIYHD